MSTGFTKTAGRKSGKTNGMPSKPTLNPSTRKRLEQGNLPTPMIPMGSSSSDQSIAVRRKIETLATTLNLPTVRRALGALEGEHPSSRGGGGADPISTRDYTEEDEARLIDWKLSARTGRPMITDRERLVTSRIWLMLDVGIQMNGACPSGERAWEVGANALSMFAALSCRRHDTISLVLANNRAITRIPTKGGLAQFERALDKGLERMPNAEGNLDALIAYANAHTDDGSMVVIATDETSLEEQHIDRLRAIGVNHHLTIIDIATLNPFAPAPTPGTTVTDAYSGRRIPAFMKDAKAADEVRTHREYVAAQFDKELRGLGASTLRASGSIAMFDNFVSMVSASLKYSRANGPSLLSKTGGTSR